MRRKPLPPLPPPTPEGMVYLGELVPEEALSNHCALAMADHDNLPPILREVEHILGYVPDHVKSLYRFGQLNEIMEIIRRNK